MSLRDRGDMHASLPVRFTVPRIPNATIRRAALLDHLHASVDRRLILVAAAAGSGKSALLSAWVGELDEPVAWLSCDDTGSDGPTFWRNLERSVRQAWSSYGLLGGDVLIDDHPSPVGTSLASDLAAVGAHGVIVIDDFHLARPAPDAMVAFIAALPPTVRLALGTRVDPPFSLARMRVQGTLLELRQRDLRFRPDEARAVLDEMAVTLSDDDLRRLCDVTEGWPAGVHLAGLSMLERGEGHAVVEHVMATDRHLADFFLSEVIQRQPCDVQEFLAATAQLDSLDVELCDAVTGRSDSAAMLERIRAANLLLVELGPGTAVYRYHHLFQEFLRVHAPSLAPAAVEPAHRAAAREYARRGDLRNAVRHCLALGDVDQARTMLRDYLTSALSIDDGETAAAVARRWLREIGTAQLEADPSGLLECTMALDFGGDVEGAEHWLRWWDVRAPHLDPTISVLLHGAWCFHHVFTGDAAAALERGRRAEAILRDHPSDNPWMPTLPIVVVQAELALDDLDAAAATLTNASARSRSAAPAISPAFADVRLAGFAAQLHFRRGDLVDAADAAGRALRVADRLGADGRNFGRAEPELVLAQLAVEHDRLEDADTRLERAMRAAEGRRPPVESAVHLVWAQLAAARGDHDAAASSEDNARAAQPYATGAVLARIEATAAHLALRRGDLADAHDLIRRLPPAAPAQLLAARLRLSENDVTGAVETLERAGPGCVTRRQRIERGLLLALARSRTHLPAALDQLRDVIALAEPSGFHRTLVDEGPPLWKLLEAMPAYGPTADYISGLLAAARHVVPPAGPARAASPVESLTDRELAVLRYLASRLDSTEIAEALYVSVHTVRSHVKAIYRKLGVNSRANAVAQGRSLGLLEPMPAFAT